MEVILLKDTEYGDKGKVVKVADGYARNYLFPNKLAIAKTSGNLKHVANIDIQRKNKLAREKAEVETVAKKINEAKQVVVKLKGSEDGHLFGSLTNVQIAELIKDASGVDIDKRRVQMRTIKEAGSFEVPVKLTFGITALAKIKVELEVEKKADDKAKAGRKKPRKKEEILSEIEAQEAAQAPAEAPAVVAEEAPVEKPKKAKKAKKE